MWGGTPTSTAFLFGAFSLAFCLKEKAAKRDGRFMGEGCSPSPSAPLPPLPMGEALFFSKFLDPNFFQKGLAGCGTESHETAAFSFGAFLLCLLGSKEKRLSGMGFYGRIGVYR